MMKRQPEQYSAGGATVGSYPTTDTYGRHRGYAGIGRSHDKACEPLDPAAAAAAIGMGGVPIENQYLRTWQLQHPHKSHCEPTLYGRDGGVHHDSVPYVEHIYESPKFDHKDYSSPEDAGDAQYYELDPSGENSGTLSHHTPAAMPMPSNNTRGISVSNMAVLPH